MQEPWSNIAGGTLSFLTFHDKSLLDLKIGVSRLTAYALFMMQWQNKPLQIKASAPAAPFNP